MADIMLTLVRHIVNARFEDLPAPAVESAKKSILDTIAVSMAGSTAEGCREVVELVKGWGGKKESTIWFYGGKVPSALAGLAIGPMARARDYGDVYEKRGDPHVTEYILPVALPLAECLGGISGKDLITAVALGQDLAIRFQCTIIRPPDNLSPHYCISAIFGPTAAAIKLLGMDEATAWNAMGLAFTQVQGEMQGYRDGALSVRLQHGFVAEAAIKAALLAQKGVTGPKNIVQGEFSFYLTFAPEYDLKPLTSELGKSFEGAYISIKPYPACKLTHGAIDATLDLVTEHDIKPQDIKEIDVGVGGIAYNLTCRPEEIKTRPRNVVDCQFSVPYAVATAVVKRSVLLEDFTEEARLRPEVWELMPKIKTMVDPAVLSEDSPLTGGADVTIKTKGGKEYSKRVYYVKGHPKNKMTMSDVAEKFRLCQPFSIKPLARGNVEEVIRLVSNLEEVGDVARIPKLLVPNRVKS